MSTHGGAASGQGNSTAINIPRVGNAVVENAGMVCVAGFMCSGTITTVPTGWTFIRSEVVGSGFNLHTYRYIHLGATDPSLHGFVSDVSGRWAGVNQGAFGSDQTAAVVDVSSGTTNTSSALVTAPGVDPNFTNDMLFFFGASLSTATWTPPSGMTEAVNGERASAALASVGSAYQILAVGTPTGDKVATASIAAVNAGILIALKDASPIADGGGAPADHPLAGTFTSVGIGVSLAALGNVPPVADSGVWGRGWYWNPAQGRVGRHFE